MSTCHNNPKTLSRIKINKYALSDYALLTYCSFDLAKDKRASYRGKDCKGFFIL